MAMSEVSEWQIEADRRLLKFESYEEYLDSLVADTDMLYLRGAEPRILAELGYRSSGETLSRKNFAKRRQAVMESLYPRRLYSTVDYQGIQIRDPLLRELAIRERSNRIGILATVIHLHEVTKDGYEMSGYIDFRDRLGKEVWVPYFTGKKKLVPTKNDLGMYHWRTDEAMSKNSSFYKVCYSLAGGMDLQCRPDRLIVRLDPMPKNATRTRVYSPLHKHAVLYDHLVRQAA